MFKTLLSNSKTIETHGIPMWLNHFDCCIIGARVFHLMRKQVLFLLFMRIILALAVTVLAGSCSTTKYVPQGDHLLNKVEIGIDNRDVNKEELYSYLRQRENTRILGFLKFHLWLYNRSSPDKAKSWLKKAGESPEIYSQMLAELSKEQLKQYLYNKGYYNASVGYDTEEKRNNRKLDVKYRITTGEPYLIKGIRYEIGDTAMKRLFDQGYSSRMLKPGSLFDLDILDRERDQLVGFFRNRGYYNFSKSYIFFEADTVSDLRTCDLKLFLDLSGANRQDSLVILSSYRINRFAYHVLQTGQPTVKSDTISEGRYTFVFPPEYNYRPELLMRLNKMSADEWYNAGRAENTFNALNRLRQFRFINMNFSPAADTTELHQLDCRVDLSPLSRQSTSVDIEGTNTSGNFGIAGNLSYLHRNLFRGAEIFEMKFKGAMERQQAVVRNESRDFNTRELGVEGTLTIPQLLGPVGFFSSSGNVVPRSLFTLAYNYQRRPDYTRTISTMRIGYEWMTSEFERHNWNLMDFNMVNLSQFDPEFINSIYDLYIRDSFTDHLLLSGSYSYVYNTQNVRVKENYTYLRFSAEASGNLLNFISVMTKAKKSSERDSSGFRPQAYYKLFDTRYAQFVKGDIEFRKGYFLDKYNSVVGRLFLGVGLPYGNLDVMPFEKKYFTGGANGIRAWQVRSLGPGTYDAPAGSYPNQSGDIKIEGNLEYRFKLIKYLDGAFFIDAGNVWAINEKDNRPGAQFKLGSFYNQLALGSGMGFRFDFDYFVFRLDLGMKMRDPAQPENNGWITGNRKLTGNDFNLSFAIGYPF